jgi:hypothetical protein
MDGAGEPPPLLPDQSLAPTRARYRTNYCVKNMKWTKEEDDRLLQLMSDNDRPHYASFSQLFPGKTGQQVAERWDKVLNPQLMKGSWTREEDEIIINFVKANGTKKWQKLCDLLPGRIGKQCRERWRNHLDPAINHAPWTPEEDSQLIELHKEHGNAWVTIARRMKNRSDNAVKNRWNATLRKCCVDVTTPGSSPFVALMPPMSFLSPVLSAGRSGQKSETALEENRSELLKLMVE